MNELLKYMSRNIKNKEQSQIYKTLFKEAVNKPMSKPVVSFNDIEKTFHYQSGYHLDKFVTHIGQRKLFLSELQFLNRVLNKDAKGIVVYAGAAPSNHTLFLSEFFPNLKFVLVDPARFYIYKLQNKKILDHRQTNIPEIIDITKLNLKGNELTEYIQNDNHKIFIIQDFFTNELAGDLNKLKDPVYFISDIRTNPKGRNPTDLDVVWNLSQQFNWMCLLKPLFSLFKFRHPYYEEREINYFKNNHKKHKETFDLSKENGIDFVDGYLNKKLVYPKGVVYVQAWPGYISTESRLFVGGIPDIYVDYGSYKEYEDTFYYYNSICRGFRLHPNENISQKLGFDRCNDCSLESSIWSDYYTKHKNIPESKLKAHVLKSVNDLMIYTKRPLKRDGHGFLFEVIDETWLKRRLLQSRQKSEYFKWVVENKSIYTIVELRNVVYSQIRGIYKNKLTWSTLKKLFLIYDTYFFGGQILKELQKQKKSVNFKIDPKIDVCKLGRTKNQYILTISPRLIVNMCKKQYTKVQKDLNMNFVDNVNCLLYTFEHQLIHLLMVIWGKLDLSRTQMYGIHGELFGCMLKEYFGY